MQQTRVPIGDLFLIMAAFTAPYGSWVSPITSDVVVKESISLMEVRIDPFQEGRIIIYCGLLLQIAST